MTGIKTSLANRGRRRAYVTAWLALGLAVLPLVPIPAVIVELAHEGMRYDPHLLPTMVRFIVSVSPTFALPAFAFGCFVGAVVHLQVYSADRVGALEAGQHRAMGMRPIVASGLLVGSIFAATGLVLAAVWPGLL